LKNKTKDDFVEEIQNIEDHSDSDFYKELEKYKRNGVKWESYYDSMWSKILFISFSFIFYFCILFYFYF
jgi:hypothetical protein